MSCLFDYTAVAVSGKVGTHQTRFNHTSWVTVVTPTDRPKSVLNGCLIEVLGDDFVLPRCFLDFSLLGIITDNIQTTVFFMILSRSRLYDIYLVYCIG